MRNPKYPCALFNFRAKSRPFHNVHKIVRGGSILPDFNNGLIGERNLNADNVLVLCKCILHFGDASPSRHACHYQRDILTSRGFDRDRHKGVQEFTGGGIEYPNFAIKTTRGELCAVRME